MGRILQVEPKLHVAEDIPNLSKKRPWCATDLDGTLTKGGARLLMETFVEKVEIGNLVVRQELLHLFEQWHKGTIKYEPYLIEIGNKWSEMLYAAKETRAHVKEVAEKWFDEDGYKRVQPFAVPMMSELERFRFNRMMVTGAPGEIAYPFAAHIGIEHVLAMMADVDSNGVYSEREILREMNTGIQTVKGGLCDQLSEHVALGMGLGDTVSDSGIAMPTIHKNPKNDNDIQGRFILIKPRPDVLERMRTAHGQFLAKGKIVVIDQDDDLPTTMEKFESTVRGIFRDNNKEDLYYEILGYRAYSIEEVVQNKARRDELENEWEAA